uniref:Uncharacterized protein n=1 Tax=Arundo donax TaxID=35708 RepID=A0A0A9BJF0_ARUDO
MVSQRCFPSRIWRHFDTILT